MAEVMHHLDDAVDVVEEHMIERRSRRSLGKFTTNESNVDLKPDVNDSHEEKEEKKENESLENSVYYDKNQATAHDTLLQGISPTFKGLQTVLKKPDSHQIQSTTGNQKDLEIHNDESSSGVGLSYNEKSNAKENIHITSLTKERIKRLKLDLIEDSDDEVIELEFERPGEKPHSHDVYCPNCNSGITKVVLRRRSRVPPAPSNQPLDLLGCLSCFSLFIPTGGCFNLSRIFRKGNGIPVNDQEVPATGANTSSSGTTDGKGRSEGLRSLSKNGRMNIGSENPQQKNSKDEKGKAAVNKDVRYEQKGNNDTMDISWPSTEEQSDQTFHTGSKETPSPGQIIKDEGLVNGTAGKSQDAKTLTTTPAPGYVPPTKVKMGIEQPGDSAIIDVNDGLPALVAPPVTCVIPDATSSKPIEILKSVVYGGLTESITSLSIVSSAAASDVSTLNILALALANLIGGLFILGHDLRNLKNDDSGDRFDRYHEWLGRRENFLLHATVAVLSYILFGLVPPATYAFSFYESNDKDFKLLAVAAASLLCVLLLAIAKAYVQSTPKFYMYLKTMSYYVIAAFMASGASYAAGSQIKKLMENLGLFDNRAAVAFSLPEMKAANPSWPSF